MENLYSQHNLCQLLSDEFQSEAPDDTVAFQENDT